MNETVATVVVTYNRKKLLIDCLDAICNQTKKTDALFIIDNVSTDGTPELLLENYYIPYLPESNPLKNQIIRHIIPSKANPNDSINIVYTRKFENDGGAGGFHEGIKQAYDDGYDLIWVMDDDVEPKLNCLEKLTLYFERSNNVFDVLLPDRYADEENSIRWRYGTKFNFNNPFLGTTTNQKICGIDERFEYILSIACLTFEGPLFRRKIIERIGNVNKDFFIINDDTDFSIRIIKSGIKIGVVSSAILFRKIFPNNNTGIQINKKIYYQIRNSIILDRKYGSNIFAFIRNSFIYIKTLLRLFIDFIRIGKFSVFKGVKILNEGFVDGFIYNTKNTKII